MSSKISASSPFRLILGTYTDKTHLVDFYTPTPTAAPRIEHVIDLPIARASWWTRHPKHADIWYAALEADDDGGLKTNVEGFVAVYRIAQDGQWEELGRSSARENPCHVEVVAGAKGLAVANFTGGSALLVPLNEDGTFVQGASSNYVKYEQVGERPSRGHQCVDMPSLGECWVAEPGNACVQRMAIEVGKDGAVTWTLRPPIYSREGGGPRQIVATDDGKHLYALHARSCTLTHQTLSLTSSSSDTSLVSTHNFLPAPYEVDLSNASPIGQPPTLGAALSYHVPSKTLIATSRFVPIEKVDSVTFFKLDEQGAVLRGNAKWPARGKEYRGVGLVGDCFLVAGQHDGWMSCFEWNVERDEWEERLLEGDVWFEEVVDIHSMA